MSWKRFTHDFYGQATQGHLVPHKTNWLVPSFMNLRIPFMIASVGTGYCRSEILNRIHQNDAGNSNLYTKTTNVLGFVFVNPTTMVLFFYWFRANSDTNSYIHFESVSVNQPSFDNLFLRKLWWYLASRNQTQIVEHYVCLLLMSDAQLNLKSLHMNNVPLTKQ